MQSAREPAVGAFTSGPVAVQGDDRRLGCNPRTALTCIPDTVTPLVVAGANIDSWPWLAAAAANRQCVYGAFDDHDVRVTVQAVMGWPVERGRLVAGRCPGGVAVLRCAWVAGDVSADKPVDVLAFPEYRDDELAAIGVDQLAGAGPLGEVELQQLVLCDPMTDQMPGKRTPLSAGAANYGLASIGCAPRPNINAACFAQVGLGDANIRRGREELPREVVDGMSPSGTCRQTGGSH
jgi:hypothetical protein